MGTCAFLLLPSGLKFLRRQQLRPLPEPADNAVHSQLEELPTNQQGVVGMVTMPGRPGQPSIKLRGTAAKELTVDKGAAPC